MTERNKPLLDYHSLLQSVANKLHHFGENQQKYSRFERMHDGTTMKNVSFGIAASLPIALHQMIETIDFSLDSIRCSELPTGNAEMRAKLAFSSTDVSQNKEEGCLVWRRAQCIYCTSYDGIED